MSRTPRRGVLAAALLVTAALTAGCFSGSSTGGGSGRLRVALPFPPAQALSPFGDDSLLLTRLGIADSLVELDALGTPRPSLAESWSTDGATTWRFRIREGVRFHDGTPLTAAHAADSLTRAAAASPVPRAVKGIGLTAVAESPRDLVVTTGKPDPVVPQRLSSPNLVILAPLAYQGGRVDPTGAGTGPFVLKALNGNQTATLDAFPDHWAGAPAASGVDVRFVPDGTARAAALRAGEVDLAHALSVASVASLPTGHLLEVPLPRTVSLHLNASKAPFSDPALRAAARETVDGAALAAGVYEGHADAAHGIYGPASPWAAQRPAPNQPGQAGTPAGQTIVLATYGDRAELPEVATVIAEALRRKGFVVEQVVREYSQLEPELLTGVFDAVVATRSYLLDTGDPGTFLSSDLTCEGSYNLSRLCDAGVDSAIEAIGGEVDVAARQAASLRAEAAVLATGALVPLVHERSRIGVATGVLGVPSDPYERRLVTRETRRS